MQPGGESVHLNFLDDIPVDYIHPVWSKQGYSREKKQNVLIILPNTAERWGESEQNYKSATFGMM